MVRHGPMTKNTPTKRAGRRTQAASLWTCPKCARTFTQVNQRHACGTGDGGGAAGIIGDPNLAAYTSKGDVRLFTKSAAPVVHGDRAAAERLRRDQLEPSRAG